MSKNYNKSLRLKNGGEVIFHKSNFYGTDVNNNEKIEAIVLVDSKDFDDKGSFMFKPDIDSLIEMLVEIKDELDKE